MPEQIEHPSHYVAGEIEAWDVIWNHGFGYHLGNVVKYLLRAGNKGPAIDDLRKARQYLRKALEILDWDADAIDELRPSYPTPDGSIDLPAIVRAFQLPVLRERALRALCDYHHLSPHLVHLQSALYAIEHEITVLGGKDSFQ